MNSDSVRADLAQDSQLEIVPPNPSNSRLMSCQYKDFPVLFRNRCDLASRFLRIQEECLEVEEIFALRSKPTCTVRKVEVTHVS